ncbi:MAG: YqjF family protein [Thermoleophilaceae bacterium]
MGLARSIISRAATASELAMSPLRGVAPSLSQPRTLDQTGHRPWPLPRRPWFMAQTWEELLFAHWRVPVGELRRVMPPQIPVDEHDGSAWLGVTPFRISALRLRGTPHIPGLSSFPEVNVRTYATIGGRPGIYFLSLDAARALAVAGARRAFRLPYFEADMSAGRAGSSIGYRSTRTSGDGPPAALRARYRPVGSVFQARDGTLEHFLTERYCLYTLDERGRVLRGDIHHPPWPLQEAEAEIETNTMPAPYGLTLPDEPPLLHFSRRQDVVIWSLEPA